MRGAGVCVARHTPALTRFSPPHPVADSTPMPLERVRRATPLSRAEFEERLRAWYQSTDETRIGDGGSYGGAPWVWVRHGTGLYHLNADTKREGVGAYLNLLAKEPSLRWIVGEGRAGKLTKVLFGDRQVAIPGFYLYRK